jgi:hypothetical protein
MTTVMTGNAGATKARGSLLASLLAATAIVAPAAARAAGEGTQPANAAGYEGGRGFFIVSSDGNYRLRPGLLSVVKAEPRFLDGASQDRDAIYAMRPSLSGNVVRPWITFLTELELAQNPPFLLYGYVDLHPWPWLGFKIGQQDTPFSRHENYGLARMLFPAADTVAQYFWGGRDKGVTAYGSLGADRVDYFAGLYGGSPLRQFTTIAGNYVVDARLTISPLGKTRDAEFAYVLAETPAPPRPSFTLQGYYGKIQSATENFDADTFNFKTTATGMTTRQAAAGADFLLQASRVVLLGEGYARRTTPPMGAAYTSVGAWGQIGVLVVPRMLDVAVRLSWANPSTSLSDDRLLIGEAQVATYVQAPTLIVKLRYGYGDQQSPGMAALGPVTLPATAGRTQVITLQLNLSL